MSEYVKYNNEEYLECNTCGVTKLQEEFRKRKGGIVHTSCRDCVNIKYIPDPTTAHLNAIRCRAKREGLMFNLTKDDLSIPKVCPVLGIPLHQEWAFVGRDSTLRDNCPSVDRFIPELGYTLNNTSVISSRANRIKTDSTSDELRLVYQWICTKTLSFKD